MSTDKPSRNEDEYFAREEAERLAKLDKRYRPFANQLSSLAQNYQSKAVLRLVEEHWQSGLTSHASQ